MRSGFFCGIIAFFAVISTINASDSNVIEEKENNRPASHVQNSDNGTPNTSARFKSELTSLDVFADLLVWNAQESGSENWAEVITSSGSKTKSNIRDVNFDWDAGFRVGLGYGMRHDQWDTQFYYTWFRTQGTDHVSSTPGSVFSAFLGNFYVDNPNGAGISGVAYQKASMRWMIRFNMFDWELGRNFWVSKALSLRPSLGLKGGWIHQSIHTKWQNPNRIGAEFFNTARENLKNNFWGIGPVGGLNTKWNFFVRQNHAFNLFGDLSGAIMWGHWTFRDVYKNDIHQKVVVKLSHINGGATMLRTFMGFGWDADFNQRRHHLYTKLGYEMQFWLDQLQFYSFDTGRLNNELTLQGGTLEIRIDF